MSDPMEVDPETCIVCQSNEGNDIKPLTDTLASNFVRNITEFDRKGLLTEEKVNDKLIKSLRTKGKTELEESLKIESRYRIHKRCYDKFNDSKLRRALESKAKKAKKEIPQRTRRSQLNPMEKFVELCMYCGKPAVEDKKHPERENRLHAAAGRKVSRSYAEEFTAKTREMALFLEDTKVLNICGGDGGDVRSLELYYHNNCNVNFINRYNKKFNDQERVEKQGSIELDEFIAFTSVKDFIDEVDNDVFDLSTLERVYLEKLAERGRTIASHITRFAIALDKADIGLTVLQSSDGGKHRAFRKSNLASMITDSDWVQHMRTVVEPIRKEIIGVHDVDKPDLSDLSTEWAPLPYPKLRFLVSYLCHGKPDEKVVPLPLDTICQQMILNTNKKASHNSKSQIIRHSRKKECFRIQYETIKLFSVVRCKSLIHILFEHGITLSYDRILSFINELSQSVRVMFNESDKVLPSALRRGIFTVFVDDNVDKNSSSVDAKKNFHGTGVTVLQFPTAQRPGSCRVRKKYNELTDAEKTVSCNTLATFTTVNSINEKLTPCYPIHTSTITEEFRKRLDERQLEELKSEDEWLDSGISWTGFHAAKERDSSGNILTINVPLPLINYKSSAIELQYHLMKTALQYTEHLNPGQVTVGCSDLPLYALKKTLQLSRPNEFGTNYFCFMGGLHIEQASLVCVGQLITGSGMDDILNTAALDTVGLKTAVCDVNNIKKARYTIQVIAVVLSRLLKSAFESSNETSLSVWIAAQQNSPMFTYWFNVQRTIKVVLLIIRSFREANIDLMIVALEQIVPIFFALDHIHYSRWASVFLEDLKLLPLKMPILYDEFKNGHFVVNTRGNKFSKIAMDQAQEHNNKKIKSSGSGYIDLVNTEDTSFLEKVELCLPEIHEYLQALDGPPCAQGHKEINLKFIEKFQADCTKVNNGVITNPFMDEEFTRLNSSFIFPAAVVTDCAKVFSAGKDQYKDFCQTRFILGTHDIVSSKIRKNDFKLLKDSDVVKLQNPRILINDKLLNRLRDACEFRKELSMDIFKSEWTGVPESFVTKEGTPFHNTKSKILDCLGDIEVRGTLLADAIVFDLSVILRSQACVIKSGCTFNEFGDAIIKNITDTATSCGAKRLDMVVDLYNKKTSIKYATRFDRKSKGFGHQISFQGDTIVPNDLTKSFLLDEENKTNLNAFIVERFLKELPETWLKKFCVTNGMKNVFTEEGEREIYNPENLISILEEADNRIVCHIADILRNGFSRISVKTSDSDVVVILLSFMKTFKEINRDVLLNVDFIPSKAKRKISVNKIFDEVGEKLSMAMMFFHTFTGADATTSFFKISKKEWFASWMKCPFKELLTDTFISLSYCPSEGDVVCAQPNIQKFVSYVYSRGNVADLDYLRWSIFRTSSSNELRVIPPSKDALLQHLLRCSYQTGWVWGNSLQQHTPPAPDSWGWRIQDGQLRIYWGCPDVPNQLQRALSMCQCRKKKCTACKCAKNNLKCLKFCNCSRLCLNT